MLSAAQSAVYIAKQFFVNHTETHENFCITKLFNFTLSQFIVTAMYMYMLTSLVHPDCCSFLQHPVGYRWATEPLGYRWAMSD